MPHPTILEIEAKEREIAARQHGGYRRADRVWLRAEALRQLRAEQNGGGR